MDSCCNIKDILLVRTNQVRSRLYIHITILTSWALHLSAKPTRHIGCFSYAKKKSSNLAKGRFFCRTKRRHKSELRPDVHGRSGLDCRSRFPDPRGYSSASPVRTSACETFMLVWRPGRLRANIVVRIVVVFVLC